jgi:hypothetical protein
VSLYRLFGFLLELFVGRQESSLVAYPHLLTMSQLVLFPLSVDDFLRFRYFVVLCLLLAPLYHTLYYCLIKKNTHTLQSNLP